MVADAPDTADDGGVFGVGFDEAPEADDEVVDGSWGWVFIAGPDGVEDFVAADGGIGVIEEVAEDGGLAWGEGGGVAVDGGFEAGELDGGAADGDAVIAAVALDVAGAFEAVFEAEDEFLEVERFDDVVLGAEFEALDAGLGVAEGGEEDEGGAWVGLADDFGEVEAGAIGEADIEEGEVEGAEGDFVAGFADGFGPGDGVAVAAEAFGEGGADVGFVLDHEEAWW